MFTFTPSYITRILAGAVVTLGLTAGQVWAGASAGEMLLTPSATSLTTGQSVTIEVRENSGSTAVNAVQANVEYGADTLKFESVDTSTSAFDIKAEERNAGSTVFIARGKTGAALTGNQVVAKIKLSATAPGTSTISFGEGTAIARADDNTGLPLTTASLTLNVTGAGATPSPTPSATPTPPATPTPTPSATPTATPKPTSTPTPTPTATPLPGSGSSDPTLPDTGAETLGGGIVGLGSIAYAARAWYRSKHDVKSALRKLR